MSIINDALKKTQANLSPAPVQQPQIQPPVSQPLTPQPQADSSQKENMMWGMSVLTVVGLIVCITLVSVLFFSQQGTQATLTKITPAPDPQKQILQIVASNKTPQVINPTTLTLNGIISDHNEQVALINNQILKAGDYINGKRILSISSDTVEIFDNGKIVTLTAKNN